MKIALVWCIRLTHRVCAVVQRLSDIALRRSSVARTVGPPTGVRLLLVLVAMVVLAAACGGAEPPDTSQAAADTAGESGTEPAASPAAAGDDCEGRSLNRTPPPGELREIDWTHEVGRPTWYTDVDLTPEQIAELCERQLTAAFLNVASGPGLQPYRDGVAAALEDVGMELVTEAYAEFDAAKQANDVETAMALGPDLVLGLPVDAVSGGEAFRPVVESDACLVLGGVEPEGYQVEEDYFAQITFDLPGLGHVIADALAEAAGDGGKIGFMVHDADFFITNTRDEAALEHLEENYPDIEVVREPMANPANAEEIANAMITRNPDLNVIFAPWSAGPADGVLAALRSLGREDIKVVTSDLDEPTALSMVQGGPVTAVSTSFTYEFGYTWAVTGMQCLLDLPSPTVAILPATLATAENVDEIWPLAFGPNIPLPDNVQAVIDEQ